MRLSQGRQIEQRAFATPLTGTMSSEERVIELNAFNTCPTPCVMVATRAFDTAVDFRDGCCVVQMRCHNGSRRQEMQRCGRGTRSVSTNANVVVFVSKGQDEMRFAARRAGHMMKTFGDALRMSVLEPAASPGPEDGVPLDRLLDELGDRRAR